MRCTPLLGLSLLLVGCSEPAVKDHAAAFLGRWDMTTTMNGREIPAEMVLTRTGEKEYAGTWSSQGRDMELRNIVIGERTISFDREVPGGNVLHFDGTAQIDVMEGTWSGAFGDLTVRGERNLTAAELAATSRPADDAETIPNQHDRPIVEENGRTLLWAGDDESGETEWFDMTNAAIDPVRFQYGIGKDTIASIDEPEFAPYDDPRVTERGITPDTPVLGVAMHGVARAYPVSLMSMHEVVNDEIAGKPYAVLW